MKIKQVDFAGSVADPGAPPPDVLPQVAFSGRSNVGKSSLINTLLGRTRRKIAHVSGQPGKTQTLNFYRVNNVFFLVDLPGFGYAKAPMAQRAQWKDLIERYLSTEKRLRGVVYLVDSRHPPMDLDIEMIHYLSGLAVPTLVVLTKIDKVKKAHRPGRVADAATTFQLDEEQIVPFSSKTGEGRDALLGALTELLATDGGE